MAFELAPGEPSSLKPRFAHDPNYVTAQAIAVASIYIPGQYRFPGLDMAANGCDIYHDPATTSKSLMAGSEGFVSIQILHRLVVLASATDCLFRFGDLPDNLTGEIMMLFARWTIDCYNARFLKLVQSQNKTVYIVMAHFYALSWKFQVYVEKTIPYSAAELTAFGMAVSAPKSKQKGRPIVADDVFSTPRASIICRELVERVGESGKRYLKWVLDIIEELT